MNLSKNVEDTFGLNLRRITFKIVDAKTIISDKLILKELVWVWVLEVTVERKYNKKWRGPQKNIKHLKRKNGRDGYSREKDRSKIKEGWIPFQVLKGLYCLHFIPKYVKN